MSLTHNETMARVCCDLELRRPREKGTVESSRASQKGFGIYNFGKIYKGDLQV